jgi:hypothetical protein
VNNIFNQVADKTLQLLQDSSNELEFAGIREEKKKEKSTHTNTTQELEERGSLGEAS